MSRTIFAAVALFATYAVHGLAAEVDEAYLFAYFRGERAGLHLAYSDDGLKWTALNNNESILRPTVGEDRLMRDPSICQGPDGTFHMVWTSSWHDRIIGYASSKDLVCWSEQRAIPVMAHEPTAQNSWAPELTYDDETGEFYIYWATTIPGRHAPIAGMDRKEYGRNHRIYLTTTRDFVDFSPTRLWFDPGFSVIDAAIVRVPGAAKKWMMVVKNENHTPPEKNLRVTFTDHLKDGFPTDVSGPINPHPGQVWVEGPSPLAVGGTLFVYFDVYGKGRYGVVASTDGGKTWTDRSDELSLPEGIRHGTAFRVARAVADNLRKKLK